MEETSSRVKTMSTKYMERILEEMKIENASFRKSRVLGGKEMTSCSYKQQEIPKSPTNHAMEFLCRSWSPNAYDFLQEFSPKKLLHPGNMNEQDDAYLRRAERTHVVATEQKNIKLDFNHWKTWLSGKSLTRFLRSDKEKKRDETRLHTAELHAALSLAQLAAAIAGISSSIGSQENSPLQNGKPGAWDQDDIGSVLSSAAALVTTACAEAAESLGARRAKVKAAVDSGMAIHTPTAMIEVTAMAATCLRGVSLLRSRATAKPLNGIQEMLKKGTQIWIIMPSGRKECTRVNLYSKDDHLMLGFRKKYFRGALTSTKECTIFFTQSGVCYTHAYKVTNIMEERPQQANCLVCLKTQNGVFKLLFEDEMQSRIWISTIVDLLEMHNPSFHAGTNYQFH